MIYVDVTFINKAGIRTREEKGFADRRKALRFMYGMKRKGNPIHGWRTDDAEDHRYLWERFHWIGGKEVTR